MSAVYFLGVKEIKSKKSGKTFYPANFLTKNNWGDWQVLTKFCASPDVYQAVCDIDVGAPVVCSLGMTGELCNVVQHDTVPALLLDDSDELM